MTLQIAKNFGRNVAAAFTDQRSSLRRGERARLEPHQLARDRTGHAGADRLLVERVTGSTARVALVMKTSSAARSSSGEMRASTTGMPLLRGRARSPWRA